MYLSSKVSRARLRAAQRARDNRAEIIKARSIGQITRRDLFRWGIVTTGGLLACKNGLSPFAPAFGWGGWGTDWGGTQHRGGGIPTGSVVA